ncbi:pro-resilin-like [Nymphalis io]|uniref:pro-resilin-like n=1 Tax=Inachis io TaxID=171585 RepID=UPI00216A2B82|nr:pro-resilin-like [Nymphalis io]
MRIFVFITILAYALAEPPVGKGYASARSSHNPGSDIQHSLSQEYGVPEFGSSQSRSQSISSYIPSSRSLSQEYGPPTRTSPSQEYGTPNLRSGLSQEYGPPSLRSGISQVYGVPNSRSLSQQYGAPFARNTISTEYGAPSGRSQDRNLPNARLSQEYGAPQLRSDTNDYKTIGDFPSDSYGTPLQRSPSYEQPDFRSTPSEEYGVPSQRNFEQSPSQKYGQASSRKIQNFNSFSRVNSFPSAGQNKHSTVSRNLQTSSSSRTLPQTFGTPRSISSQYGAPSTRNFDSYSQTSKSVSQSYLPNSRTISQSYGVPNERSLSAEYGTPEARTNLNTNAFASSYDTARSVPSSKYDIAAARDSMPSDNYGVPEQYNAVSNQGYNYARNALDELLNQEPANYDFGYKVSDLESGSDFGHTESRQDNKAEGSYFVVLPDGTKQTVEYEADESGFKPRISVEPAETRAGYDDNASDLARSGDGPY